MALSPIKIRPTSARDARFVSTLAGEVFGYLGPSYAEWALEWMQDSRVGTFVARRGRARLGYVMLASALSLSGTRMLANLLAIAVVREARRQGVGRALLRFALDVVAEAPFDTEDRRIDLTVAEDNAAARAMFEEHGFALVEGGEASYPAGQRSLTMSRAVTRRVVEQG